MCRHDEKTTMRIGGEAVSVDACLAALVTALNAGGIPTRASCCGHGTHDGYILCADRLLIVCQERGDAAWDRYQLDCALMAQHDHRITRGEVPHGE